MDCESNLDSAQATEEHKMGLDQVDNPPPSISFIPPEILGRIFYWTVTLQQKYHDQVPHNLLFVCHHWFEVALCTPQLWTSWGHTLQDWELRHTCPTSSELHLQLRDELGWIKNPESLSKTLRDTLQDRATRDFIQRVSFVGIEAEALNPVISAITVPGEEIQSISLESFEVRGRRHDWRHWVELSNFFARYCFPKLRHLEISRYCNIPPLDLLASRTTALVTLSLQIRNHLKATPTASQLLSVLSSNPNLQSLKLSSAVLPEFTSNEPFFQVQLPHLKLIELEGDFRDGLRFLRRLVPANKMDFLKLCLSSHLTPDVLQTLAQYLEDHIRCRGDLVKGLAVDGFCRDDCYLICLGDVQEFGRTPLSRKIKDFMMVTVDWSMVQRPQNGWHERLFFDSLTYIHNHIVYYRSFHSPLGLAASSTAMPRLTQICAREEVPLSEWLVNPDPGGTRTYGELLSSLKYLELSRPMIDGWDWSALMTFLSCCETAGSRLEHLIVECHHMCMDIVEEVKGLVQHVEVHPQRSVCPHGRCPAP